MRLASLAAALAGLRRVKYSGQGPGSKCGSRSDFSTCFLSYPGHVQHSIHEQRELNRLAEAPTSASASSNSAARCHWLRSSRSLDNSEHVLWPQLRCARRLWSGGGGLVFGRDTRDATTWSNTMRWSLGMPIRASESRLAADSGSSLKKSTAIRSPRRRGRVANSLKAWHGVEPSVSPHESICIRSACQPEPIFRISNWQGSSQEVFVRVPKRPITRGVRSCGSARRRQ
jgi:hypothetical protein